MAALALLKKNLSSRAIRKTTTGNKNGIRTINPTATLVKNKDGSSVWSRIRRFGGFLMSSLGWVADSAGDLWSLFRDLFDEVWYFDFNITAEEQLNILKAQANAILLELSGIVGSSIGWIIGGAIGMGVVAMIPVIGPKLLAKAVKAAVVSAAVQDLVGRLTQVTVQAARITIQQTLVWSWIGFRNMYRASVRAGSRLVAASKGGDSLDRLNEYYQAQDAQPWTFQSKFRSAIESLPDLIEPYIERAIEDGQDSLWEAGFVVAAEIDAAYQAQEQQDQADLVLKPDKDADETFYLYGPQQQVMQQAHQLLQNHRTLANRDVGYVVGDTELSGRVPTSQKTLKIFFFPYERPPWRRGGRGANKVITSEFVIKDLKTNITWQELKTACKRFTTGSTRVTAFLDNGRQMWLLANTDKEGQDKITELVALTTRQIMRFSSGEQKLVNQARLTNATSQAKPGQLRPPTILYPAYAYLFINLKWVQGKAGHPAAPEGVTPAGDAYFTHRVRFNLHPDKQPANFPSALL